MVEAIIEGLFSLLAEIFFQVAVELLFNLGFGALSEALKREKAARPYLAGIGFIILGVITGALVTLIAPERIVPSVNLYGLGVMLSAVGTGTVMMFYGKWRRVHGKRTTYLATFWGGSLFAFSMALTRWVLIQK